MLTNYNALDFIDKCGVYLIKHKYAKNKFYIGSTSRSFRTRFQEHINRLANKNHSCRYLQYAYNRSGGSSAFEFEILEAYDIEKVTKTFIIEREQFYLDIYKPPYNSEKSADYRKTKYVRKKRTKKDD